MKIKCDNCGTALNRRPAKVTAAENHFCCRKCYDEWQSKKVEVLCATCGATLERHPYRVEAAKHHFCNASCKGQWMSQNQTGENHPRWAGDGVISCEQCGKAIRRTSPSKFSRNERHFCSKACFADWKVEHGTMAGANNPHWSEPIRKPCDFCGKPLERNPARVGETERTHHFCNAQCRANWQSASKSGANSKLWQGGTPDYYGPNWRTQQRKARQRDGNRCQYCGKTKKQEGHELDVHHIRPFRDFGYIPDANDNYKQANELTNLICLCRSCHTRAEAGTIPVQPKLL